MNPPIASKRIDIERENDIIRIISARKATRKEREDYEG
jgi:uncharacterized protein